MTKQYAAYEIIHPIVIEIRKELARRNDIRKDAYNEKYAGLCYTASDMFIAKMEEKCKRIGVKVNVGMVHGEQAHNPRIPSSKWGVEHTWNYVIIFGEKWYIDCTSSQFQSFYNDIPEYIIQKRKPKWYYPDRSNPKFNGITLCIDQKIKFKRNYVTDYGEKVPFHSGLIDILQYDVWGTISDTIRKILGKDKKNE